MGLTLPFGVWMLRTFVTAMPKSLEEAAWIDGAGRIATFWKVLFPLVAPGLVATSIFSFITAWNDDLRAGPDEQLGRLHDARAAWGTFRFGQKGTDWGAIMASSR